MKIFKHAVYLPFIATVLGGCVSTGDSDKPATGKITAVEQQEKIDEKTGEVSVSTNVYEETAEMSVADKGAESLISAQKFVAVGAPFSSYGVGSNNRIVASVYNQEGKKGSDIWVFYKGKSRLTKTNYHNNTPKFSTDEKYVYFASSRNTKNLYNSYDQNSYLWRMPANGGGGITRIGTPVYDYRNPAESPDNSKLLYSAREYSENSPFIWYSSKTGELPTQLTQGRSAEWASEDTIVFSAKDENSGLFTIWTSKLDGSELTQIIEDTELHCLQPSVNREFGYIAYVKQKPTKKGKSNALYSSRDVYIYDMKSGLSQQITTNISRDDLPHWSTNGSSLFFRSTRGLAWNIWKISTDRLL